MIGLSLIVASCRIGAFARRQPTLVELHVEILPLLAIPNQPRHDEHFVQAECS